MTHFMFAGLLLRAGGQALPPATMSMTPSYFTRKKKEIDLTEVQS